MLRSSGEKPVWTEELNQSASCNQESDQAGGATAYRPELSVYQ